MVQLEIARRSARVERLLREHAGGDAGVLAAPLSALAADGAYARTLALELESLARDAALRWPLRRIAALMLETALFRIKDDDPEERRFWIERLGLVDTTDLARQGYKADEPMTAQLWRRLARLRRVHRLTLKSDRGLSDYLQAAKRECRLTLARSLFSVDEVIARIEQDVRRSSGQRDPGRYGQFAPEAERAIEGLPAMERTILEHLGRDATIRWASKTTTSTINGLVEYPITTVVLTVKPPGSTTEIEIKRAGRPRDLPLDVVWCRDNWVVPSSHHLDGGAMHHLLTFEAENSAFFSRIFREVHGFDASMSRTIYISRIFGVSTPDGEADLLDYFTSRRVFGKRFMDMRWNVRQVVKTLTSHAKETFEEPANEMMLTGSFIGRIKPAQAIQVGTTSFRLDRLERYLGAKGAERYFKEGVRIDYDAEDARRFADEILDEVLCEYEPPRVAWRSHAQYVAAAFRVPANRARANRNFVAVLAQLGRFWGTLLGLRGHAQGESFVARNAGLRSVWADGEWQLRLVLMDHDSMAFSSVGADYYRPRRSVKNQAKDAKYVLGGYFNRDRKVRGDIAYLRDIFRTSKWTERQGMAAFRTAMKQAYDATQATILGRADLSRFFRASFIEKLRDWDELVSSYLATPQTRSARTAWKAASRAHLATRGYSADIVDEYVGTVTDQAKFLRRIGFLFSSARKGKPAPAPRPYRARSAATSRSRGAASRPHPAARAAQRRAPAATPGS
ncbi:MAG: hypothetical protein QOH21_2632 [Acidobacteriota bacterium]|jgi:hypothetical protein|nr:hypothetical protein [Acidobacteriota bacterium]